MALTALAAELCPDLPLQPRLRWHGQVTSEADPSRPDLEGSDGTDTRVVLEAKFDADLTAHQVDSTYLNRLPTGQPGLLLYLAPQDRLPVLWPELLSGPGGQSVAPAPEPTHADAPWLRHEFADGRVLAVIGWPTLIRRLRGALVDPADAAARSDLEQLSGLVSWRTRSQWTPVLPGDLPPRTGRQLTLLVRTLLLEAAVQACPAGARTRSGSADAGPGRYVPLDTTAGGPAVWVGLWLNKWAELGYSPLWLQAWPPPGRQLQALLDALAPLAEAGGPGVFDNGSVALVPLIVPVGKELGEVTGSLVEQISRVTALIKPLLSPTVAEAEATPAPTAP